MRKLLLSEKNKLLLYLPRVPLGFTPAPLPVRELWCVALLVEQPPLWSLRERCCLTLGALLALAEPWPSTRGVWGPSVPGGAPGAVSQCHGQHPGASAPGRLLAVRAHQAVVGCGFPITAGLGRVLPGYPVHSIASLEGQVELKPAVLG